MTDDPFARIGLPSTASADEVRSARKRLAKEQHPDVGGNDDEMQQLNVAVAEALRLISGRDDAPDHQPDGVPGGDTTTGEWSEPEWSGSQVDAPSFTVEALPVETFQALLAVADQLGSVVDDEPPYRLEVELPTKLLVADERWQGTALCRLDVVPDAGASTVSLLMSGRAARLVSIERVRDLWIGALNELDWDSVVG